ncbi:MAG TPA: mechanosensitive ion channel family protein [Longimicrobiales bacterium]|nr:mechanosensitive ion channel family protein [Longimicrobiales bacterium]
MDILTALLDQNSARAWLISAGVALVTFLLLRFVAVAALGRLAHAASRTRNIWDDVLADALQATRSLPMLAVALYAGGTFLVLPGAVSGLLASVTVISLLVQAGLWISRGLTSWLEHRTKQDRDDEPARVMTMNVIGIAAKVVLWSMVLLLALDNLGVDVTALVAGLGVGGVAVALAAQSILGDLFASLSIVLDKPFVLGDFLVVGDFMGSVEAIGLKTTRIRSLSGEQVVFSNSDLLGSRVRNFGRMFERRVVTKLGVTYQTARESLVAIPGVVRDAVEGQGERVRFDRSHMSSYGDFAIVFESVYYVLSPDYNTHMDIQQAIFLQIHEEFENRGIEFAYPTQTVFVQKTAD